MNLNRKNLGKLFLLIAGCIILHWLLNETSRVRSVFMFIRNLFAPFAVGAGFAFVLNVPVRAIESRLKFIRQHGLRRALAVVLTVVLISLVLFLVIMLLIPQISDTVDRLIINIPVFFNNAWDWLNDLLQDNPEAMAWIQENTNFEDFDVSGLVEKVVGVLGNSLSTLVTGAFSAIGSLSTGIFNAVVSIVFGFYCLFRKEILARQGRRLLYAFLPEHFCDETVRILRLTSRTFSNFISGQFLEACILGVMFWIAMTIFKMPYAPLVSVLVGITALVPIVGAFVGCILGAFFILVDDPVKAIWFVVMFLILQQIEGNLIYPRVVGKSVGLPGMWVLLAVSVGGELMGVAGMFIMIPLFSVAYTLLREITGKRLLKREIVRDKLNDHPPERRNIMQRLRRKKKKQTDISNPECDNTEE